MKKTRFDIIFIFSILLSSVFASCAIHEPMSEMVMFQQKKSRSDSTYFSKYSHAIASYTTELNLEKAALNRVGHYTEEDGGKHKNTFTNPAVATTHLIFLHEDHQDQALSLAISSVLFGSGADVTFNIFNQYYFTAAFGFSTMPQTQLILQRRLLDGNPIGLSLGAVWSSNNRFVKTHDGSIYGGSDEFYTSSLGIRAVLMAAERTNYGAARFFLHSSFAYNYDLTLKVFYPKIGISFGVY